jgi:hypothetical protein
MTETAVTSQNEDEDNDYEGYMQFGDGAILSIQELLEALSVLNRDKNMKDVQTYSHPCVRF